MKGNRFLVFLAVVAVVLLGVFGWLMVRYFKEATIQKKQAEEALIAESVEYPFFPENSETYLDDEKQWQRKSFQPIFKEYVEASMGGYLVVSYKSDSDDGVVEGKVALLGQISYVDEIGKSEIINRATLKDFLKQNDQFGVEYLALIPADYSTDNSHCLDTSKPKIECQLAYWKKESDSKGETIFYPFFIYRKLKP